MTKLRIKQVQDDLSTRMYLDTDLYGVSGDRWLEVLGEPGVDRLARAELIKAALEYFVNNCVWHVETLERTQDEAREAKIASPQGWETT